MDKNTIRFKLLKILIVEIIFLILSIISLILFNLYVRNTIITDLCGAITSTLIFFVICTFFIFLLDEKDLADFKNLKLLSKSERRKTYIVFITFFGGLILMFLSGYIEIFSYDNEFLKNIGEIGKLTGLIFFFSGIILLLIFFGKISIKTEEKKLKN
jgi:hypothetical protein